MATVPTGRLTRKQIVDLAARKAGNTQLAANSATAGADAQTWLNQILFDLYSQYNWPFLNTSTSLVLTSVSFSLPTDFLKAVDDYSFQVQTVNGASQQFFILEVDRGTFEATTFSTQATVTSGLPRIWTADRNTGMGKLFPDPSGTTLVATLRYQFLPPDIDVTTAGDSTIPTFPWHFILVQALYVQMLEFESDPRVESERAKLERMLEGVRQAAQPLRAQEPMIPLDPTVFTTPFRSD